MRVATGAALALFLGASPAGAASMFTAIMNDAQEVPPGGQSNAAGQARASLQLVETEFPVDPYVVITITSLTMQIDFDPVFNFKNMPGGIDNGGTEIVQNLHIHNQVRGQNGGVVWGIFAPDHDTDDDAVLFNDTTNGTTRITAEWDQSEGAGGPPPTVTLLDFVAALRAAGPGGDVPLYLNLHTAADPAGAIRGQIVGAPEPAVALLLLAALGGAAWRRRPAR